MEKDRPSFNFLSYDEIIRKDLSYMYQNNYGILLNIVQSFKNDVHVHVAMLLYVSSAKGHLSVENEKHC